MLRFDICDQSEKELIIRCVLQYCCRDWLNEATLKPALLKQASGVLKKIVSIYTRQQVKYVCINNHNNPPAQSQSELPVNFAEPAVYQAYFTPDVDCSAEEFEWGKPDLDLLRK